MSAIETFYVLLGLASIVPLVVANRQLYRGGPGVSAVEAACYAFGLLALLAGWYFNFQYFREYGDAAGWWHWCTLLFANSASASGGQDLVIANVLLFPLWIVVDGKRDGVRAAWWCFPMSLLTSFAFAMALFMALQQRARRRARA